MALEEDFTTLLGRVLRAPPGFYQRRLRDAALSDLGRAPAAFARLALTRRDELVRDQLDNLPHGTRRFADAAPPVRTGITGTGAELLVLTWTAADLARERAAGARFFAALGVAAGKRVANTLPGELTSPGSLLLGDVIEELGALDIPLGAIETDAAARQAWELIDRVQPELLVLEPATTPRLLTAASPLPRPWWRGVIFVRRDGSLDPLPELGTAGFSGWQRSWFAVAEASSFVASSCASARWHIQPGVLAEVVDEMTGAPSAPGSAGALVLTPLAGDTVLLRYVTGRKARAIPSPCECGTHGMAIEPA